MIIIGGRELTLEDFDQVLFHGKKVDINKDALTKVEESHNFLKDFSRDKIIYGINTSFGPMAQYRISDEDIMNLQYNLIRSHATGAGKPLPNKCVKAAMIARMNNFLYGFSGIHPEVVELLRDLINNDIYPFIPKHGGVGASGDLVQLAHLGYVLIGEGKVHFQGKFVPTHEAFESCGLKPIKMHIREGLALINGTSVMTGIGVINTLEAKKLLNWSVMASAMINDIVESYDDHFSAELNGVKQHGGQQRIAEQMRVILNDSKLIKKRPDFLYNGGVKEKVFKEKIQEYYSLRCVPQVLGPILETIENTENVLIREANSVNDNPIIDSKTQNVYHGGNFHGDYVSLEMDKLKISITKLSMLTERQLNYLFNSKLNDILPPFVNLGTLGLNLGMQACQFTATSTVAENQTLSFPNYVHSIPNNNDNQDIVSMGTNSALFTRKIIYNSFEVMAIHFMAITQAIEYLNYRDNISKISREIYDKVRAIVPKFVEDTEKYTDIENVKNFLIEQNPNLI